MSHDINSPVSIQCGSREVPSEQAAVTRVMIQRLNECPQDYRFGVLVSVIVSATMAGDDREGFLNDLGEAILRAMPEAIAAEAKFKAGKH